MTTKARNLALPLILCALAIFSACQKDEPPPAGPAEDPAGVGTSWTKVPQSEILWPSLANSPWPTFLHDFQHTGRSSFRGPQEGVIAWTYETGHFVFSSPVIGPTGTVYANSLDGYLYALSSSGGLLWRATLGGAGYPGTTIGADGTIYSCPSTGNRFHALSDDGTVKWTYANGGIAYFNAPLLSYDGRTIYAVMWDSSVSSPSLFALAAADGRLKWKFTPSAKDLTTNGPAFSPDGKTIYCPGRGTTQAPLYAVDTSGTVAWMYTAYTEQLGTNWITVPCVDNAGNIFFGSGRVLYSLSSGGGLRWKATDLDLPGFANGPVIGWDGSIYIVGNSSLYAFDNLGNREWARPLPTSGSTPAIDRDGIIYAGSSRAGPDTANVYAFQPDGSLKFKLTVRNVVGGRVDVTSSPAISNDLSLYVGSDANGATRIYKIR